MKTYICVKATMMFRVTLFIVYIIYLQIFTKSFLLDRHCFLNQDIKEKKKKMKEKSLLEENISEVVPMGN